MSLSGCLFSFKDFMCSLIMSAEILKYPVSQTMKATSVSPSQHTYTRGFPAQTRCEHSMCGIIQTVCYCTLHTLCVWKVGCSQMVLHQDPDATLYISQTFIKHNVMYYNWLILPWIAWTRLTDEKKKWLSNYLKHLWCSWCSRHEMQEPYERNR